MDIKTFLADSEQVPDGFSAIGPATHPTKRVPGMLARNRKTGIYVLVAGGASISVPHKWASDIAVSLGKGSDAIQDQCIARMEELGLNPNKVAEMVGVSRSHVCDYLTRRASMGSHNLQHVLKALKLSISSDKN